MATSIRSAQPGDAPALLQLLAHMDAHDGGSRSAQIDAAHLDRFVLCTAPRAEALIAFDEGAPVGLAAFHMSASTLWSNSEVYLDDLFVEPEVRSQGTGRALVAGLASVCRERGAGRILLSVRVENTRGIQFYERIGGTVFAESRSCEISGAPLEILASEFSKSA